MVDYSERRPVNTNRPRKQGMVRYFVLTALGGILAGYGLGLTSGWFIFKPSRQELNALRTRVENAAKPAPAATPPPQQAPVTGTSDPNLSFYKTLPGGKGTLGTGLNPDKPENPAPRPAVTLPPPVSSPSAPVHTAAQPQQPAIRPPQPPMSTLSEHYDSLPPEKPAVKSPQPAASPAPAPLLDSGADPMRKAQLKGKYVVQVASYQSKTEAEAVKGRLQDSGVPAYIVESVLKDKGTMYRVRVGKHLEPAAAAELAAKAGKNAIVILE
jgi:cell division protein FtsN